MFVNGAVFISEELCAAAQITVPVSTCSFIIKPTGIACLGNALEGREYTLIILTTTLVAFGGTTFGFAEEALGDNFDIKEFHDLLLKDGTIPLVMMREKAERWVEEYR